eukprot:TRINITY_DN407_c0_g1_i1.p1 TRINITY_DN407_c0_g1~~TRINITY_DN407_c0_g1_i1.p1  ORF type:complete len:295 (+),score=72.75 TRINITY_DN407_c0_g1_i1:53-937(+)
MDEEPSRVLHLRNVTSEVTHQDLHQMAAPYGKVENIIFLRDKNQALIQMDSIPSSTSVLNSFPTGYTEVSGRRVYLKYSRHSELTGKAAHGGQGSGSILLVSMSNPQYDIRSAIQITADLLYQVFAPYGTVTKIVVIQKHTGENRQQALVQFDSHQTAEAAKQFLQGQNVYVGTSVYFSLDMQFSNLDDLTVRQDSPTSRTFGGPEQQRPQPPFNQTPPAPFPYQQQSTLMQQQQQQLLQQQLLALPQEQQQQLLQQQLLQQQQQQQHAPPQQPMGAMPYGFQQQMYPGFQMGS